MSHKENNSKITKIKVEPPDHRLEPLKSVISPNIKGGSSVKTELNDVAHVYRERGLPVPPYIQNGPSNSINMPTSTAPNFNFNSGDVAIKDDTKLPQASPIVPLYKVYDSALQIDYVPENALKEGMFMVKDIKRSIKALELGSKLRQDVWLRDIGDLEKQGAPTTLIAVCGATGAGKSSILNAILDDNIVPTSGMRACTAVVTEVAYHRNSTIDADVSFLSEMEWRQELGILLLDLVDEDGHLKRSNDLKSDAGIAWQKVHAVYPLINQEKLVKMSVDQIISCDQQIARTLGTTKHIVAKDSKAFAQKIAQYVDSKNQKRGKKDKKKEKGPTKGKAKDKRSDPETPALWPLIRQVNVRCRAKALSTGAILVDLPGVADANVARNNIAKDYMKKCDCIWILAPITRAVDDKTARDLLGDAFKMQLMMDGNYDDHSITFIASKCDDISCSEVIRALNLDDDPELEEIEERIVEYGCETSSWKKKRATANKEIKTIEKHLKAVRKELADKRAHLEAVKGGESFKPKIFSKKSSKASSGKKRKNTRKDKQRSPKRRRGSASDDEGNSEEEDVNESDEFGSDEDEGIDNDSNADSSDDSESEDNESADDDISSSEEDDSDAEESQDITEHSLEEDIKNLQELIKSYRLDLSRSRKDKKNSSDHLSGLKKNLTKVQREKNGFCSLKRSEFSRDVLKEDFRVGLKDLDDSAAEERDPDNFDPTISLRNYESIDLPVFTCSSRDYVRLKGQVKGDGDPTCFSNVRDTGIPELQQWCHRLTVSSRERAAKSFMAHLKAFVVSIHSYVKGIGEVTVADREALRTKWESSELGFGDSDSDSDTNHFAWGNLSNASNGLDGMAGSDYLEGALYSLKRPAAKVDAFGRLVGITPTLCVEFAGMVDNSVKDLQDYFIDGLEEKCKVGAANAAEAAVNTSDEFVNSMHWGSYRATLRRYGSWRRDLNVELCNPFTRNIAHSWSKVFESDLFSPFETAAKESVNKLLTDVEESAAPGLKDRVRIQAELCQEEARVALENITTLIKETMNNEQKEVSRCMAPHVRDQLVDGYDEAMEERGRGSVARQRACFRRYVEGCRNDIFDDGAEVVMSRLTTAAEAIGKTLNDAFRKLAQKVEVNLSVLWESTRDNAAQIRARSEVIKVVSGIQRQIQFWTDAESAREQITDTMME